MILHIIHSSVLALLFYGVYHIFLKKETFFQYNRWYLLAIPVLSICIPFIILPFDLDTTSLISNSFVESETIEFQEPLTLTGSTTTQATTPPDYATIAWLIYGTGVLLSIILFSYKLLKIKNLISKGEKYRFNDIWITKTDQKLTAFSFFNQIVVDKSIEESTLNEVIAHEQIHIQQRHSHDLIFFELVKIIFWFHPISYLLQKELRQVHEFIVDQALSNHINFYKYQQLLLKSVFNTDQIALTSSYFNSSLLKNRILMLQKTKSTRSSLIKLAFILPIVIASLIFTACNQQADDTSENIISTNDSKLYLPRLSTYEYGKKDIFNGLSETDIELFESFMNKFDEESLEKNNYKGLIELFKNEDGKRLSQILPKIYKVARTLIVDDVNQNFKVVYILELPGREAKYSNASSSWNSTYIQSYVDGYLTGALKDRVSDLNDKQYQKMISRIIKLQIKEQTITEVEDVIYENPNNGSNDNIDASIPFTIVEKMPVYPGTDCTGDHSAIKKCFSDAISTFVNKNFNTGVIKTPGKYKIQCQFLIDKNGDVKEVVAIAKLPELEKETQRVIESLPKMTAGFQGGKAIGVVFALPITMAKGTF